MSIRVKDKGNFLELDDSVKLQYIKKNCIISIVIQEKQIEPDTRNTYKIFKPDMEINKFELLLTTSEVVGAMGPTSRNENGWFSESKCYNLGKFKSKEEAKITLDEIMQYLA